MTLDSVGVLICGFYGYSNMGDEAMLAGMIRLLRQHNPALPLTVLTFNPEDTQRRHGIETVATHPPRRRLEAFKRWLNPLDQQAIKANSGFVLGGGDLLRDGADREVAGFWLAPLQKALKLKRKTALLGVSVGEIWKPETQQLIPQVLNQVDLIAVRDQRSKDRLQALSVNQPVYVMPDLALAAVHAFSPAQPKARGDRPQIGISVRWMSNRGQTVNYSYEDLQREIAAIADYAADRYNAIVHFLPFQAFDNYYSNDDDDYIAILEILKYSDRSSQFQIHRYLPSLETLMGILQTLDVVIGMRLHSLILAAGLGVPVIAAEYDPKVEGFMTEISQRDRSIPLNEFHRDRIIPLLDDILAKPEITRRSLAEGLANYQARWDTLMPQLDRLLG